MVSVENIQLKAAIILHRNAYVNDYRTRMALVNQGVRALAEAQVMFFSSGFSLKNPNPRSFGLGGQLTSALTLPCSD